MHISYWTMSWGFNYATGGKREVTHSDVSPFMTSCKKQLGSRIVTATSLNIVNFDLFSCSKRIFAAFSSLLVYFTVLHKGYKQLPQTFMVECFLVCYSVYELMLWIDQHTVNVNMTTLTIQFVLLSLLHDIHFSDEWMFKHLKNYTNFNWIMWIFYFLTWRKKCWSVVPVCSAPALHPCNPHSALTGPCWTWIGTKIKYESHKAWGYTQAETFSTHIDTSLP